MPLEILDSEDDGVFDDDDHLEGLPPNPPHLPPSFPAERVLGPPSSGTLNQSESLGKSQHVPTSGELRQQAIDEAHKALIAPSSAMPSPEKKNDYYDQITVEGTIPETIPEKAREKDIYDFDDEDEDEPAPPLPPPPPPKSSKKPTKARKRRRALTSLEIPPDDSDDSDFEEKPKKRQTASTKKQRSKTMPMPIPTINLSSEDEYDPKPRKPKERKTTRTNTNQDQLLPPLPKPKRKKKDLQHMEELQDYLPLPADDISALDDSRTSPQKAFMIDMTHEDLVLPTQKKQEYDNTFATNPVLDNIKLLSDGTPVLDSTLPDPPEVYMTFEATSAGLCADPEQISSPEHTPFVNIKEDTTPDQPSLPPVGPKPQSTKRRTKTDSVLVHFDRDQNMSGGFHIASEWRAARGKGLQNLSDKPGRQQQRDSPFVEDTLPIDVPSDGNGEGKNNKKKAPRKPKEKKDPAASKAGKKDKEEEKEEVAVDEVVDSTNVGDMSENIIANDAIVVSTIAINQNAASTVNNMEDHLAGPSPTPKKAIIKLKFNPGQNQLLPPPPPPTETAPPSPGCLARRTYTKSRFAVDSDDDMDEPLSSPPPSSPAKPEPKPEIKEPAKTPKAKLGRKSKKKAIAASDESGDDAYHDKVVVVSDKSPSSAAKRKRTKTIEHDDDDAPPPTKKAAAKKKGGRKKTNEKVPEDSDKHPDYDASKDTSRNAAPVVTVSEEPRLPTLEIPDNIERLRSEQPKTPVPVSPEKKAPKSSELKQRGSHSPIRTGKVPYRVGLSKRARIEPLLSIRKR
ncbi:hypothetical protein K440DRAFT_657860 [Wilcoxina mikolae CBS 423.85]|nr:hypothetical protein K440DRAFT_657860 [Wilcoxina mikolae CBS 423.85]